MKGTLIFIFGLIVGSLLTVFGGWRTGDNPAPAAPITHQLKADTCPCSGPNDCTCGPNCKCPNCQRKKMPCCEK